MAKITSVGEQYLNDIENIQVAIIHLNRCDDILSMNNKMLAQGKLRKIVASLYELKNDIGGSL